MNPRSTTSAPWRRSAAAWWAVAGALVVAMVAACGGGVGTGGTGAFASGPISGFGSIIVGGVRFNEDSAQITDDDALARERSELRLGTVVEVESGEVRDGTAVATRVRMVSDLIGSVEAVAADALVVNGLTVRVNAGTVFDDRFSGGLAGVAIGRVVEVYGFVYGGSGEVLATRVEPKDGATAFKVRGFVSALNPSARTFGIGSQQFVYPAQLSGRNELHNGAFVRVVVETARDAQGRWPVSLVARGTSDAGDRPDARAQGLITAFTSLAQFDVNGAPVDASAASIDGGPLAAGLRVEVEGRLQGGMLIARSVKVEDPAGSPELELNGIIVTLDIVAKTFVLDGRGEKVGYARSDLVFENGTMVDLALGRRVKVSGALSPDGTRVDARRIRFIN